MNPVLQALALGYSAPKVLEFIKQSFPGLLPKIKKAQDSGYPLDQILKIMGEGFDQSAYDGLSEQQIHKARGERQNQIVKDLGKIGLGSLGAIGIRKALPFFINSLKGSIGGSGVGSEAVGEALSPENQAIGQQSGSMQPNPSDIIGQNQSSQRIEQPQSASNVLPPTSNQATTQQPPSKVQQMAYPSAEFQPPEMPRMEKYKQDTKNNASKIINELGIEKQINDSISQGKNLEQVSKEVLSSLNPKQKSTYEKSVKEGQSKPMVGLIKDYLSPGEEMQQPQEPKKPVKGEIVATPHGVVGELKSIRDKEALVEDSGKLHKVKIDEIEQPSENMIKTVANLLKIPEIDKSSLVSYWAYDPEDSQLFVQFHNGESYKYKDVDAKTISDLAEALGSPKTEGENVFGAWSQDDPKSVGATMIQQIIANPKYKRAAKGHPRNPNYLKLGKGYDYWKKLRSK